ncbi:MAG: hypothetical protein GY941_07550, partial [Planctomycetes bacterium]|nr:hypothetical protein [Planctomycetota bacterium]
MTDRPKRGRPPMNRAETTRRARRMTKDSASFTGMKLTVDESKLDRDKYEYRFANDKDNR